MAATRSQSKTAAQPQASSLAAGVTPKGRKPPPPNETKHERFQRLGRERLRKALVQIRLIGNLANRSMYEWQADDLQQFKIWLHTGINQTFEKFEPKEPKPKELKLEDKFVQLVKGNQ